MRYHTKLLAILLIAISGSSCDYLDIVPEKTQELSMVFERREQAYKALATCYSYLPLSDDLYGTHGLMTDELTTPIRQAVNGIEIMRGQQSVDNPLLSYWQGFNGGVWQPSLYNAIYDCNIFLENIVNVPDMTDREKREWSAEVRFLKAYYHFLLVMRYGPIPIMDKNFPISASPEEVRVFRNSIDECFDYIEKEIDLAISDLPARVANTNFFGRVDRTIAAAIKSRVLLYAASPLFNGNAQYYAGYTDKNGKELFNTSYDNDKWRKALEAAEYAIELAESNGVRMYYFDGEYRDYDNADVMYIPEFTEALYSYKFMFVNRWNSELIWGLSRVNTSWHQIQATTLIKNAAASSNEAAWQWLSPTYRMAELYYTQNGLPIDQDLTFDYDNRHELRRGASADFSVFVVQIGQETVQLHFDREPRFYATIAFDRGYNRAHGIKQHLRMRNDEVPGGKRGSSNDYLITGYGLKKYVHPDSQGDGYGNLVNYPWPLIRMAELYLNYAEAYNEYVGPGNEVYEALNEVRQRAGLPNVEDVWSNASLAKTVGKHTFKDGLREIIQQERLIELAFEGHRYDDIRRWKKAEDYFTIPVKGWDVEENQIDRFYTLINVGERSFITPRDYFHPIRTGELSRNPNLIQNLGW
ncbi:RagB/SusD family nutrient uptake outer membrane protein [Alkalitalea saponilacus]|uniref:Starch-binding associating with outer membrane n=1 Tax=Alkalitalea saponilacus TaxID=889453 RepID=A0A1T5AY59_9BACT|nr:RagB/SusD family nutrient uptake outer membrane protein [Alkalitalea saponilacus]ASB48552.1 RagB/SusD family nutrient uptake outer membrane protein [Alkalitalea saponilacus]SKB39991.1 Starch-binding associating with outer membrane [Alkalitalea saponilacus]